MPRKRIKRTAKKQTVQSISRKRFFELLDNVIRPLPDKAKPQKKEKKGTSA